MANDWFDKQGGSAFPVNTTACQDAHSLEPENGMSLRDYFAAKAMQSIIAKSPFLSDPDDYSFYEKTAIGAYDYAEHMIKAREGK